MTRRYTVRIRNPLELHTFALRLDARHCSTRFEAGGQTRNVPAAATGVPTDGARQPLQVVRATERR